MKSKQNDSILDSLKPYFGNKKNPKMFFDQETERVYFDSSTIDTKDDFSEDILRFKKYFVKGYRLGELLVAFLNLDLDELLKNCNESIGSMINEIFNFDSNEVCSKEFDDRQMKGLHPYIDTNDIIPRTLNYIYSELVKLRRSQDPSFKVKNTYRGMSETDMLIAAIKEFSNDKTDDNNDHYKNYLRRLEELNEEIRGIKKVQEKYRKAILYCFNGKATVDNKSKILLRLYYYSKSNESFNNNKIVQDTELMMVNKNTVLPIPMLTERHKEKFVLNIKKGEFKAIESINYTLDDACYYELLLIAKHKKPYISVCQHSKCNNYFFPSTSKNIYCGREFETRTGIYLTCKQLGARETRRKNPYNRIFDDMRTVVHDYLDKEDKDYKKDYEAFFIDASAVKINAEANDMPVEDYRKQLKKLLGDFIKKKTNKY